MVSKKIYLRARLNSSNLKYHIKNFFKLNIEFELYTSEYINLQTNFGVNKISTPNPLGTNFVININNDEEKDYYINYLINQFKKIGKKDILKINIISFNFNPATKKEYENFYHNYRNL